MEITAADGVVALVIFVSAILAYSRGITREAMAIGGWIVSAFAAFYFGPLVAPLVLEIPVVGDALRAQCTLTALAAFIIVFVVALIVMSFFTPLLSTAVHNTPLAAIDRGLGFLFGAARGVLLVGVLYLLYDVLVTNPDDRIVMIDQSASHGLLSEAATAIEGQAPTDVPAALQRRIDRLLGGCGPDENAAAAALTYVSKA